MLPATRDGARPRRRVPARVAAFGSAALLCLLAVAARAQHSEATPPREPRLPRVIGFPVVGYAPETSVAFAGLGMLQLQVGQPSPSNRLSTVSAAAAYTLRNQWLVSLAPSFYLRNGRAHVYGDLRVQQWDGDFYGLGRNASLDAAETFVPREARAAVGFRHRVADTSLSLGTRARIRALTMHERVEGGLLESVAPPGYDGARVVALGAVAAWDTRDLEFFPRKGAFVEATLERAAPELGADHAFWGAEIDARAYKQLGRRAEHIVAAQARVELRDGTAPFFELPTFGGMNIMRGVSEGLFRDQNGAAAQVEYRSPFVGPIGFVAFAGAGEVFGRFAALGDAAAAWSAGGGVRLAIDKANGVNARLDYGVSRNEFSGIYLSVTEAF